MPRLNWYRVAFLCPLLCSAQIVVGQTAGNPQSSTSDAQEVSQNPKIDVKRQIRDYFFDAARRGDVAMLKQFVAEKYDLNSRDEKGYTAVILAAYHGNEAAVSLLIRAGADPCLADSRGNTALMGAIFKGELKIARQLLHAACNPDQHNAAGQTAAMYAALFGRIEILQQLKLQGANLQLTDVSGNTAERLSHGEFAADAAN